MSAKVPFPLGLLHEAPSSVEFEARRASIAASVEMPVLKLSASPVHTHRKSKAEPVRIYLDGCWDVMHSGHFNALRQAKSLGDVLVVGVHSDEEITRNKRKPIMNNEERMSVVRACKWADEVVFDVPYSPTLELLDSLHCHFCAHGDDIPRNAEGKSAYGKVEYRLKIFKRTPGVSTTVLIDRLLEATVDDEEKDKGATDVTTWSQFLSTSHRISAFSNHKQPTLDDTVVYIDGDFDLFHAGHVAALKKAKSMGTFLYVGIYDDATVCAKKGRYWPMMSLQERTLNVLSCKYVDEVVIGCPWVMNKDMLTVLNVKHVVTSPVTTLSTAEMDRYDLCEQMEILRPLQLGQDILKTDDLVKRIIANHKAIQLQNESRVKKETKYVEGREYVQEK